MPQFELINVGPEQKSGLVRGRSAEDAVRRVVGLEARQRVVLKKTGDLQGWMTVSIDGEEAGRLRLHQRMKFRRD